jgi:tetratricopeptide (TPR) repeat protein
LLVAMLTSGYLFRILSKPKIYPMVKYLYMLIICMTCFVKTMHAQSDDLIFELEEEAETYFEERNFSKSYVMYEKLSALSKSNVFYKLRMGECALNLPDKKLKAIELLEEVKQTNPNEREVYYLLAKAYNANYQYDKAEENGKEYQMRAIGKLSTAKADRMVSNIGNARDITQKAVKVKLENIGEPINTSASEYVPVISADEDILIFTYRGPKSTGGLMDADLRQDPEGDYYEDIYIAKKKQGFWNTPESMPTNTKNHDASIGLSPDGQELYSFKSTRKDRGDIYVSRLVGEKWSEPKKLGKNVNTEFWEGSCSISADGQYLYFSSERPGGSGGRDIYVSKKLETGEWGPALNLGTNINTPYNDDAPFIHPDGITVFFSSEGHNSIGGYDIFYSIKKDNDWITPINMGYPLNTTSDDGFYVINAKGDKGYFSSNRESPEAKGESDLYAVSPGMVGEKPVLVLLKGSVMGNCNPIAAKIAVTKKSVNEAIGPFNSNATTGKYLMALSPGQTYQFNISAPGYNSKFEELNLQDLKRFVEIKKNFFLFNEKSTTTKCASDTVKENLNDLLKSILDTITDVDQLVKERDSVMKADSMKIAQVAKMKQDSVSKVEATKLSENTKKPEVKNDSSSTQPETKDPIVKEEPEVRETKAKEPKVKTTKTSKTKDDVVKENSIMTADQVANSAKMPAEELSADCGEVAAKADFAVFKGKSLNDPELYKQFINMMGPACIANMNFRVQIGAYRQPQNFKYDKIKAYGPADIKDYPDGITRFTVQDYKTIQQADKLRQRIIARGIKDAWITAVVDGKRYTLEELINVDFFTKAIN